MTVTALPRPAAASARAPRWQPSRAGILNVWRYYDEVFEFDSGRLLLRGPNGSGKSKALELLLPFLFDANLRANRLSTFGTAERTMHWNMMGEGATGATRVGYVWLEFHRPATPQRWFCCGARLQAGTHTTTVTPDYFTTDLRIGTADGVSLVNASGQPLSRAALAEQLGGRGTVHATAGDYRDAVRATLFPTMTEARYDALITALLQLRTPKLSQRLDPALLSTLLSRALPPLGQEEIADLAEGFERLDAQRERLAQSREQVTVTKVLARHQRTYAQRVLRAGAAAVISAHDHLADLDDQTGASATELKTVRARLREASTQLETLETARAQATARRDGLTESDAYKHGQELDRLRQTNTESVGRARKLRAEADAARATANADEQAHADAAQSADRLVETTAEEQDEAQQASVRAGMAAVHEDLAAGLEQDEAAAPRPLLRAALRGRRGELDAMARAVESHERAVELRRHAEEELEQARAAAAEADRLRTLAAEGRDRARTELTAAVSDWANGCEALCFDDAEALAALADSEPALLAEVHAAANTALHDITRDGTALEVELAAAQQQRAELAAEVGELESEQDIRPATPSTRSTDRALMSGGPLWQLIDFAPTVTDTERAGIEAALQSSGLLDAWIGPRGQIEGDDLFTDPYALAPVNHSGNGARSLADLLTALPDSPVDPGVVRRLLEAVGVEQDLAYGAGAAVTLDGSWRMGSLRGSWHKDEATFIGAAGRTRARERRITELWTRSAECDATISRINQRIAEVSLRRGKIQRELGERPGHAALAAADADLTAATADHDAAAAVARRRAEAVSERERAANATLVELSARAAEHGVPTDPAALTKLAAAVDGFGDLAEGWLDEHAKMTAARHIVELLAEQARRSAAHAERRSTAATDAEAAHSAVVERLAGIDSSAGVEYRDLLVQITALRTTIGEVEGKLRETRDEARALERELGALQSRRGTDAAARDEAARRCDQATARFRHLAGGTFPADSELRDLAGFRDLLAAEGPDPTMAAARAIATAWPSVPHAPSDIGNALHRLSESVHDCRDTLSARADLDLETDDEVQVFTATVDGARVGAAELLAVLQADAEQGGLEITERERELFDQTLTGDTRRHLAARIRQATELVDGMNARLERVRTASNVAVRLEWQVAAELPAGTAEARDLLLKDPELLSDSDRESLHRFLRGRVEEAKTDDSATSWEQQLAQVFDYTAWHQFVVQVDRADGDGWQLLTKKLHGALSGGEKAIALHLPLFAAVAAHYQTAPEAPRVILLDEVFVGVDTTNRGQIFGLLSALDLDLVLTSDHEWCTYAELSGIGIHQLITGDDGDDAVTTARFTWNGQELDAS